MTTNSGLSENTSDDWGFSVFGLERGLKVTDAYDPIPEAGVSLLAIGNRSDLLVVGSKNIITSAQLSAVRKAANARETDLRKSKNTGLFQSAPLNGNVLFVALSPNEKNVFVYTDSATIYHFNTSKLNQSNFTGTVIKLDNVFSEKNPIVSLLARPQHSNEVLILTKSGDVYLLDVTAPNNNQKLASSVVAISWSPQGKAFLTGTSARELIQYKTDGSVFARYSLPDDIEQDFSIFSVLWKYSSKLSVTTHKGDDAFKFSLVSVNKSNASSTWLTSEEVSQPFGDTLRYPFSYNTFLKDYDPSVPFLVATSSQSSELSLLSDDSVLLPDEDSARAEFPVGEDDNEISPMGIALDYSSEILVADVLKGFEDDVTVPIVWVLDNTGSLLSWNIAYRKGIKEGTAKLENLRTAFEAASEDGPNCVPIFTASSSVSSKALSPSSENKPLVISSTQPAFGQSSTFGQSGFLPTESKSAFGQSSFAKFAPTSKETNSKSTFGQSGFGQNSFASKSGTSSPVASGTTASQSAFGAFSSSGSAFGNQNQSAFSSFATAASTSSSPFATAVSTSSSPFATVASTSSSPFATATSTSSSPFATATSTSTSPFATATSKSTSPFATVTSTSTSPFATVAAGKSPSSLFASTGAPSSFGTDSTTLTSNTTSIFNSGANKSAFGADRTTESIFGASNVSTGSAFGGNKDSNSAFPTSSDAGTSLFTNKASASDSFRTLPTDVDDENEDEAWVDEEDFEDEERDATNQPFGFSGLKLNDSKPVLNQNNPLSLFSSDQLKSNPFGSSSGNFLSTGKSKSGNYSNLFGSSNNKTVESKPSKNVAESAPLPPDPVKPVAESAPLPPDPVKTVAESAPLPPDPVKSVAESAPLPPDPVKSVAESAPLPPDPTSLKETATIKDSETSPRSSSSSSGVLVYASSSPESDAVVIDKSSDSTSKGPKTGLFSIHDATPTKAKNSGFTSIHDVDSSKSDNSKEDHSEKAFNPFEALKTAEDQQVEKGPVEDSENPESFKGSESFDESGPEEIEVKDDSASFDKVLDEIDDPYVKAYLKKKLVKELSQDDLQVLEDHDAPPIEYIQMSTQFPEPQKYTIEDYYYEPVNIEDSECDDELVSYKQYTIPKYYAFDPSVLPAVGDSYESEAINLFSEINAHYEILALNSKAISRVIDLNKPEADEDGVLITREAHTDDDLERFNEWKVSEAAEVKSLWEPIQKEVNELKKTLDIKIDNKVEKSLAKITTDLAEINKAIQYHETFLTDEHVSLGGLPARAALLQTELRKNLKKVKDELSSAEQKVAAVKSASNCGGVTINSLQNFIQKLSLGILNQHNIVEDITKRLNYFQINGGPNRSLLVGTDNKSLLLADEANNSFSFFDTNDDSVLIRRKAMLDSEKVSIVEYKQRQFARKKLSQALKVRDMRSLINSKSTLRGSRK